MEDVGVEVDGPRVGPRGYSGPSGGEIVSRVGDDGDS